VRCWGRWKAEERRKDETRLRQTLSDAQQELQRDVDLRQAQANHKNAADALRAFELERVKWMDQVMQQRWIQDGDKCTRVFFKSFRGLSASVNRDQLYLRRSATTAGRMGRNCCSCGTTFQELNGNQPGSERTRA
jgi:hypothetical protein